MELMRERAPVPAITAAGGERDKGPGSFRVCLISIGGDLFAIDLRHVREVFELESVTPVPGLPDVLIGVANLRGTVMPLADLRTSLGLSQEGGQGYAVVIKQGTQQVGLVIDGVPEIRMIQSADLVNAESRGLAETRPFLSGLVSIDGRMGGVVDVAKLVATVDRMAM